MEDLTVVFIPLGFVESTPYVEKIKAFEQYFLSQIELYDKVCYYVVIILICCNHSCDACLVG